MTLLVLAGTGEARRLLARLTGMPVVASLAGAVARPLPQGVPTRVGGFGGQAGFERYLEREGVTAVVDATHPFAARITARTQAVCAARGVAYLRLERPVWVPEPVDDWRMVDGPADAVAAIGVGPVFVATGRQTLEAYAGLAGRAVYCRQIDPPDGPFPFEGGSFIVGRPPFSIEDEVALFERLGIRWLVVKNAGGDMSRSKLDAARILGLPVVMLRRPPRVPGDRVETVEAALEWVSTINAGAV